MVDAPDAAMTPARRRPPPAAPRGVAKGPWWRDPIGLSKPFVLAAGLIPLARIAYAILVDPDRLGANPAEFIEHATGDWALQFLLLTLAVSPLRRLTGWNALIRYRRMLGLFAFAYGVIHLGCYVTFDRVFDIGEIGKDILKRPYITVGFAALVLMTPLAVTSTKGWIRRLGGPAWNRLHQAIYPIAILGVLHYWWLVKRDVTWPALYAAVLAGLLGYRVWLRLRPRPARRATPGTPATAANRSSP
jgi:sulfoxide reductase heme-binding subunit YedZ